MNNYNEFEQEMEMLRQEISNCFWKICFKTWLV